MKQKTSTGLFLFHRDLRLHDNTGLLHAIREQKEVIPCFILDPRQIGDHPYRSIPALHFMFNAIQDLHRDLQKQGNSFWLLTGDPISVLSQIYKIVPFEALYQNEDYTPFAITRVAQMRKWCDEHRVILSEFSDVLLNPPYAYLKRNRKPYTIFTPFYNAAKALPIPPPQNLPRFNSVPLPSQFLSTSEVLTQTMALDPSISTKFFEIPPKDQILRNLSRFQSYAQEHDIPARNGTTRLSIHLKFGTISIRETYYAILDSLGPDHPLLRQLYWRDFFTSIVYHFPSVFGKSFHSRYDQLTWNQSKTHFRAWCQGETGFPIVDAGMRELNETGFMHNRVRMIVASFLTKDLHIDWRWGEQYFAQHLQDYDPAVNNGNWQWTASTGCDAQPYFRIFNPWLQQKRFDPDAIYIKRWIPALRPFSAKQIHQLQTIQVTGYPPPMVNHRHESVLSKMMFKTIE